MLKGIPRPSAVTATRLLAACVDQGPDPAVSPEPPPSRVASIRIRGAGATFVAPLFARWSVRHFESAGTRLVYDSAGSIASIDALRAGRADFAATDVPLDGDALPKEGLAQCPVVLGAVVPVVHLDGLAAGDLALTPDLLAEIFAGRVTWWNDPALVALNPGLPFPGRDIVVVHRADESGTACLFTRYLARVSEYWRTRVGGGERVLAGGVGGDGNGQVAEFMDQFPTTIGFVQLSYAMDRGLAWVALTDGAGTRVVPDRDAVRAAIAAGEWTDDEGLRFDASADLALGWPLVGASYALVQRRPSDRRRARAVLALFAWGYDEGTQAAEGLGYEPVPEAFVPTVERYWSEAILFQGEPVWEPPAAPEPDPAPPAP